MTHPQYPQTAMDSGLAKELRRHRRDPRVFVGRGTYGDPRLVLYSADDRIEIGRYCSIAADTTIIGGGEHNYRTTSSFPFHWFHGEDPGAEVSDPTQVRFRNSVHKGPTRIGSDVWLGYGSMILSGVSVGPGAVIGAAAVIASDVPPFAIMVGNPGRCLKNRFDDATIERLLAIHWWDWKAEYVYQYQDALYSEPANFLAMIDSLEPEVLAAMYDLDPRVADAAYEALPAPRSFSPSVARVVRQVMPPIIFSALSRLIR
jgi:acetyltransferase-like isoleucine patch superfamily enzyme